METNDLVLVEVYCTHHAIDATFINALHDYGIIEITIKDNNRYLPFDQLKSVEQMMNLHYDLGINMEGLDAISHLLKQIQDLKQQLSVTQNRLKLFE